MARPRCICVLPNIVLIDDRLRLKRGLGNVWYTIKQQATIPTSNTMAIATGDASHFMGNRVLERGGWYGLISFMIHRFQFGYRNKSGEMQRLGTKSGLAFSTQSTDASSTDLAGITDCCSRVIRHIVELHSLHASKFQRSIPSRSRTIFLWIVRCSLLDSYHCLANFHCLWADSFERSGTKFQPQIPSSSRSLLSSQRLPFRCPKRIDYVGVRPRRMDFRPRFHLPFHGHWSIGGSWVSERTSAKSQGAQTLDVEMLCSALFRDYASSDERFCGGDGIGTCDCLSMHGLDKLATAIASIGVLTLSPHQLAR
jgi:hypothetical protein